MEGTPGTAEPGLPPLLIEAVSYAEDRHWVVAPGTWLVDDEGSARCSCGDPHCAMPGAHPVGPDWRRGASAGPGVVRRWWMENPEASIVLPTGRVFDVLDVPEVAGCLALARMERMGLQLGPVVAAPAAPGRAQRDGGTPGRSLGEGRRLHFLVLPGVLVKLPDMLHKLGWAPGRLDLVARGEGDWIVAPPSRVGPYSFAQWARPPSAINRWLPDAAELINPLAYACGREAPATHPAEPRTAAVR